jgi:hypothetical protein
MPTGDKWRCRTISICERSVIEASEKTLQRTAGQFWHNFRAMRYRTEPRHHNPVLVYDQGSDLGWIASDLPRASSGRRGSRDESRCAEAVSNATDRRARRRSLPKVTPPEGARISLLRFTASAAGPVRRSGSSSCSGRIVPAHPYLRPCSTSAYRRTFIRRDGSSQFVTAHAGGTPFRRRGEQRLFDRHRRRHRR